MFIGLVLFCSVATADLNDQIRLAYPTATNGVNYTTECQWGFGANGCFISQWNTNSLGPQPALASLPSLAQVASNQLVAARNPALVDVRTRAYIVAVVMSYNQNNPTNKITAAQVNSNFPAAMELLGQ